MFKKMTWRRQLATQLALALPGLFVLVPVLWLLRLAFDGMLTVTRPKDFGLLPGQWSVANLTQAWNAPITN